MICPMISCKRLEPYECHGSDCAWWIPDQEQGDCAIKELATNNIKIGDILDWEQYSRILKEKRISGGNI